VRYGSPASAEGRSFEAFTWLSGSILLHDHAAIPKNGIVQPFANPRTGIPALDLQSLKAHCVALG
jgi:hypothetical protein